MAISEADVQARLRTLIDPNTGKDFVAGKALDALGVEHGLLRRWSGSLGEARRDDGAE